MTKEERKARDADFKRREQPRPVWNSQTQGTYRSGLSKPKTKEQRRAAWPLSRAARLKKVPAKHQRVIDGLIEDATAMSGMKLAA